MIVQCDHEQLARSMKVTRRCDSRLSGECDHRWNWFSCLCI